jgi:hypothetical protein
MRTILILCAVTLVAGAAMIWKTVRLPSHYGVFTGAPKADVADLIERPKDFLRKTVTIEGTVRQPQQWAAFSFFSQERICSASNCRRLP